ncbi:MAG: cytochrome c biogenesis protein ResB [Thermodesulfobacteria bacterium]|nr:cytochrome c biogenesis protein ResB [Thermodesulfobacteriota bacterium]
MFKNPVMRFLSSIKLAIFLLLSLAATSIIGTILPQGQPLPFYFQRYGETLGQIIKFLHLYDTYHSWWYVTLLALFSVNLTLCSLKRLPFSLELFRRDPLAVDPEKLTRMPVSKELKLKAPFKELEARVEELLSKKLGRLEKAAFEDGVLFLKDRFRWSYFSVYVVHFSILIIIAGAIIGAVWGFRGEVNLLEGESTDQVLVRGKKHRSIPLGFTIRCDKFYIDFYPNGMPKEYRSDVTILEDGKEVLKGVIRVNDPLTYKGITFYQSSYNTFAKVKIRILKGPWQKELEIEPFNQATWEEGKIRVGLLDFQQAHGLPAARIWLAEEGEPPLAFWVLKGHPRRIELKSGPIIVTLEDAKPVYATGLQVKKDPGVPVVWLGFSLLILGIFAALFFAHQRYWVAVMPGEKNTRVILAGFSPKARQKVKQTIEELAEEILKLDKSS